MHAIVNSLKLARPFDANREVLEEVSSKIAGPWFAENVRPYLAGPVARRVGEVVVDVSY